MFHKKKYFAIAICILVLLIGIVISVYFVQHSRQQYVIESNLKIKLPSTSKIVNYTHYNDGGYFDAKISVENQSVNDLKEQLNVFFHGKTASAQELDNMLSFENTCSWWDLKKENIEVGYHTFVGSEKKLFISSPKTHEVWAFISKDKEDKYYLYISY